MNTRSKGSRTFRKAVKYAESFPGSVVVPIYQVSRWAQPQPFDMIVLRSFYWVLLVEVRTNQWGTGKASTVQLAQLPSISYRRQIWRFRDGKNMPDIRRWDGTKWTYQEQPWEDTG